MCLAKIIQRALFLGICNGPLAILREHGIGCGWLACQRAKKTNLSDHVSEYDTPHHLSHHTIAKRGQKKLRLEHPLVRLESFTLASFTTVPKNRQVVPGPVGIEAQGVEIGFECSLLDPSATEGRDVLSLAARAR